MRIPISDYLGEFTTEFFPSASPHILIKFIFISIDGIIFFYAGWNHYKNTYRVVICHRDYVSFFPLLSIAKDIYIIKSENSIESTNSSVVNPEIGSLPHLERKPNVYFLLFDSYTQRRGAKSIRNNSLHPKC